MRWVTEKYKPKILESFALNAKVVRDVALCAVGAVCAAAILAIPLTVPLKSLTTSLDEYLHPPQTKSMILVGASTGQKDAFFQKLASPTADVKFDPKYENEKDILDEIRHKVKAEGTLDSLTLSGHGDRDFIRMGQKGTGFYINLFLEKMIDEQKSAGVQFAKRIIFNACNTFLNLSPWEVQNYQKLAQKLGAEIVGTITRTNSRLIDGGRYISFHPDGTIVEDSSSGCSLFLWAIDKNARGSDNWFDQMTAKKVEPKGPSVPQQVVSANPLPKNL